MTTQTPYPNMSNTNIHKSCKNNEKKSDKFHRKGLSPDATSCRGEKDKCKHSWLNVGLTIEKKQKSVYICLKCDKIEKRIK